jgi:3-oxoadipate enol-lactonase
MPILKLKAADLYYESHGRGAPVLFVPGLGVGGNIWNPVVEIMKQQLRCITVDTRGAGYSSVPKGPYQIADLARDIAELSTALSIERPILAGHSMGSFIALTFAVEQLAPLTGLVLVSTAAVAPTSIQHVIHGAAGSRAEIVDHLAAINLGRGSSNEISNQFKQLFLSRPLRGSGYLAQLAAINQYDLRDTPLGLTMPCCIIHGTEDNLIPLSFAERLASKIPHSTFEALSGIGHFPIIESPERVAAHISAMS